MPLSCLLNDLVSHPSLDDGYTCLHEINNFLHQTRHFPDHKIKGKICGSEVDGLKVGADSLHPKFSASYVMQTASALVTAVLGEERVKASVKGKPRVITIFYVRDNLIDLVLLGGTRNGRGQ